MGNPLPLTPAVELKVFASTLAAAVAMLVNDLIVLLISYNVNITGSQQVAVVTFVSTLTVFAVAIAGYKAKHTTRVDLTALPVEVLEALLAERRVTSGESSTSEGGTGVWRNAEHPSTGSASLVGSTGTYGTTGSTSTAS